MYIIEMALKVLVSELGVICNVKMNLLFSFGDCNFINHLLNSLQLYIHNT
jgi:hypothetical protein